MRRPGRRRQGSADSRVSPVGAAVAARTIPRMCSASFHAAGWTSGSVSAKWMRSALSNVRSGYPHQAVNFDPLAPECRLLVLVTRPRPWPSLCPAAARLVARRRKSGTDATHDPIVAAIDTSNRAAPRWSARPSNCPERSRLEPRRRCTSAPPAVWRAKNFLLSVATRPAGEQRNRRQRKGKAASTARRGSKGPGNAGFESRFCRDGRQSSWACHHRHCRSRSPLAGRIVGTWGSAGRPARTCIVQPGSAASGVTSWPRVVDAGRCWAPHRVLSFGTPRYGAAARSRHRVVKTPSVALPGMDGSPAN